jgi:Spy/CpxP family protein refolding chaperone
MRKVKMAVVAAMLALSGGVFAQTPAAPPSPDFSKVEIKTSLADEPDQKPLLKRILRRS